MSESGSMMYTDSRTDIFLGYDYAGNCSAYTITGSQLDDNISLSAETDSIYIGEEVTIQNLSLIHIWSKISRRARASMRT